MEIKRSPNEDMLVKRIFSTSFHLGHYALAPDVFCAARGVFIDIIYMSPTVELSKTTFTGLSKSSPRFLAIHSSLNSGFSFIVPKTSFTLA